METGTLKGGGGEATENESHQKFYWGKVDLTPSKTQAICEYKYIYLYISFFSRFQINGRIERGLKIRGKEGPPSLS